MEKNFFVKILIEKKNIFSFVALFQRSGLVMKQKKGSKNNTVHI